MTGLADIPAGRFIIGFQAVASSGQTRPAVAVDDVELLEGTCQQQGRGTCQQQGRGTCQQQGRGTCQK